MQRNMVQLDDSASNEETFTPNGLSTPVHAPMDVETFADDLLLSNGEPAENANEFDFIQSDLGVDDDNYYLSSDSSSDSSDVLRSADDTDNVDSHVSLWSCLRPSECKLTVDDYCNFITAISTISKIPDTAMNGICSLITNLLPDGHQAPTNFNAVTRMQLSLNGDISGKISYICSSRNCDADLPKLFSICQNPACRFSGKKQQATGFLHFLIRPQIEAILKARLADILRHLSVSRANISDDAVGDLISSPAYVSLGQNPLGNELSLSLILSSDGVQAFKCGRTGFWPCMAMVAELPPKLRVSFENTIGLGFWVGRHDCKKPDWNRFLTPIILELMELKDGFYFYFSGVNYFVRLRLFATVFDLLAQAPIWGHKQFNGDFGCIRCMHPGQRSRPLQCLYPKTSEEMPPKDSLFFENAWFHLRSSADQKADYFGVVNISPLARLANPASVNLFDPMHLVYRGNTFLLLQRFFSNNPPKWTALFRPSLVAEVDELIKKTRFPHHFNRTVSSLQSISSFKASELKNFLVYLFVPLTANYLTEIPDYWHWISIYVHAIRLLCKPTVTMNDICCARQLIDIWQLLLPKFTHETAQNFNAHAVQHLPDQVRNFGALWSISTFGFEGFNGHFARLITSPKGMLEQLQRRFLLLSCSNRFLSLQVRHNLPCAQLVKQLFPRQYKKWETKAEDNRYRLLDEKLAYAKPEFFDMINSKYPSDLDEVKFCGRAALGTTILHSASHNIDNVSIIKYNISDILLNDENYGIIQVFFSVSGHVGAIVKKLNVVERSCIFRVPPPVDKNLFILYDQRLYGSFFPTVEHSEDFDIVEVVDFIGDAILINCFDCFAVTDVLPFEHD